MIETAMALDHLDAILDVDGIDAVYIGPADLSISLGLPPGADNADPRFQEALAAVVAGCERRGIAAGIHSTQAIAATRLEQGFRMVTVTSDLQALASGASSALEQVASAAASARTGSGELY
jgi:4-hydroxy-2-oxoheptanedioate aldolase